MTSERQQAANERNAQKSTGPRTAEGKERSSANAIRHGAYTNKVDVITMTLLKESVPEVVGFVNSAVNELGPTSVLEEAAARSVAQRYLAQARVNRLVVALVESSAVPEEPLTPGTATYQMARSRWIVAAVNLLRGESDEDPEVIARLVQRQMKEEASLLLRYPPSFETKKPQTREEWLKVLAGLIDREYGSIDEAERVAWDLFERHRGEAARESARRVGNEASRILGVMQNVTAVQDRTDQMLQRSQRNYFALKEQNALSPNKLLLNGTIDGDVDDRDPDEDDEEIAVDVEDLDD